MTMFVRGETLLERVVDNLLHADIDRRIDVEASLQQVFESACDAPRAELLDDVADNRGRGGTNAAMRGHPRQGPADRLDEGFARQESVRCHERQRLVPP